MIGECERSSIQVLSPISVVPKRNNKHRQIHDLHVLNEHISPPSFKQDDIKTILEYMQPGDLMITADLKNGFHHIPVAESDQKFLGLVKGFSNLLP